MDKGRRSIPFHQHLITATSKFQTPAQCGEATRREHRARTGVNEVQPRCTAFGRQTVRTKVRNAKRSHQGGPDSE